MNRNRIPFAVVLIVAVVAAALLAFVGNIRDREPVGDGAALAGKRVVVFTMPGVIWSDVRSGRMPTLMRLTKEGASAAMAPRTASVHPSAVRGYLTFGAGNRAGGDVSAAQDAYVAGELLPAGVSADDLLTTLVGPHRSGEIVHLGAAQISSHQASLYHGTLIGSLGQALQQAGVSRGVVSAGDRAPHLTQFPDARRGAAVLTMINRYGVVPFGQIHGLVRAAPGAPFGVETDPRTFAAAVKHTLAKTRALVVDAGETVRAEDAAADATPARAAVLHNDALRRTDRLLKGVVDQLKRSDLLLVLAPSSADNVDQEHLTAIVAWGNGTSPGALTSPTTHRPGLVTLTDVAPTILSVFGVDVPPSMSGRPMHDVATTAIARPDAHDELDARSVFREGFVPAVFYAFVALFLVLSVLVGLVFLAHMKLEAPLIGVCYLILAVPLVTFLLSVVPLWRLGDLQAHVVLWATSFVVAGAGWLVAGPRWTGAIPLLAATAVFIAVDLVLGGRLLVDGVFGNSVLAAGRFYGIPNTGSALFFGASVLTLVALGDLWKISFRRTWLVVGLLAVLLLTGAPQFGADVGGLLAGVASAIVIVLYARGNKVPWRTLVLAGIAAVAVTLLVGFLDSLRAPDAQTHFGRFFDALFVSGGSARETIIRKATQSWTSLSFSRFTYVVPLGVAALGVLLRRPRGPLHEMLPGFPYLRAGLAGLLIAGVLGFLLNDSGVAVPALLLGQAVPVVVLLGVDHVRTRNGTT